MRGDNSCPRSGLKPAEKRSVMPKGFLPNADSMLLSWSSNFSTLINAAPGDYNLSAAQAANYASLHAAFATAMLAVEPSVRSKTTVAVKNEARAALRIGAKQLSLIIHGQPTVSDAQKLELGLNVQATHALRIANDRAVHRCDSGERADAKIQLRNKPSGVNGASLFSYIGQTPPAELSDWKFEGNTGKTVVDVQFPSDLAPARKCGSPRALV